MAAVPRESSNNTLGNLIKTLAACDISGLSQIELDERDRLENLRRAFKKEGRSLSIGEEKHRVALGEQAREGPIRLGKPFDLILDWWNTGDDEASPKTWAGRQELRRMAQAAQDALSQIDESSLASILNFGCVLHEPKEPRNAPKGSKPAKAVEPFYFDSRRFSHRLDVGFSPDALDLETLAHPAVELLCFVGLQRFRPAATSGQRWSFDYWTWPSRLSVQVAAAVFSGVSPIPGRQWYRFPLRFRDDQKRYKAFGPATLLGGDV